MTFGEKIRNLRIACKMTQEQLAAETGIAKRSIIIYESGQRPPKMEKIYEAFAEFFNVPIDFLKVEREDDFDNAPNMLTALQARNRQKTLPTRLPGFLQAVRFPKKMPTK